MLKVNICKCGMPECYHTVGCYGIPYPDLYDWKETIICNLTLEQFQEIFKRLEGEEGCNFREKDGKTVWNCAGGEDQSYVEKIMTDMGISVEEQKNAQRIFSLFGGYCDCEILFNAVEKIEYLFNSGFNEKGINAREVQMAKIEELNLTLQQVEEAIQRREEERQLRIKQMEQLVKASKTTTRIK